jgi:hypothetical protein
MPVDSNDSSSKRASQSGIDRHAIAMTGHLLMAGIWLERRFKRMPRLPMSAVEETGWLGPTTRAICTGGLHGNQSRNETP